MTLHLERRHETATSGLWKVNNRCHIEEEGHISKHHGLCSAFAISPPTLAILDLHSKQSQMQNWSWTWTDRAPREELWFLLKVSKEEFECSKWRKSPLFFFRKWVCIFSILSCPTVQILTDGSCEGKDCSGSGRQKTPKILRQKNLFHPFEGLWFWETEVNCSCISLPVLSPHGHEGSCSLGKSATHQVYGSPWFPARELESLKI